MVKKERKWKQSTQLRTEKAEKGVRIKEKKIKNVMNIKLQKRRY